VASCFVDNTQTNVIVISQYIYAEKDVTYFSNGDISQHSRQFVI